MLKYHHTASTSNIKHQLHSLLQSFPFQFRKLRSNLIDQKPQTTPRPCLKSYNLGKTRVSSNKCDPLLFFLLNDECVGSIHDDSPEKAPSRYRYLPGLPVHFTYKMEEEEKNRSGGFKREFVSLETTLDRGSTNRA